MCLAIAGFLLIQKAVRVKHFDTNLSYPCFASSFSFTGTTLWTSTIKIFEQRVVEAAKTAAGRHD
jgi:hypothetical protein